VKTRGRPRSDAIQDAKIASAVHTLSLWGFPLRAEVFEAVAKAARQELARGDHAGFSLGPDRIEQIYKGWLSEQRKLLETQTDPRRKEQNNESQDEHTGRKRTLGQLILGTLRYHAEAAKSAKDQVSKQKRRSVSQLPTEIPIQGQSL
jgi:hypothetical protein